MTIKSSPTLRNFPTITLCDGRHWLRDKKTIGKGGIGTAYLAIHESLGRQGVLKTMNANQSEQADLLERFLNEGRIVAALRHPYIITIFDIGATDELVYMSMEYVDEGDLKEKSRSDALKKKR